ncbi:DNA polymerase III PolC-type [Aquimixticola soesokkakensis]|uniref:DNA-directed DNA polymerase n=1 Tax=Aquimixticola soesokkakensis TaxID=1519096 RepID=A0A1Y5RPC8_9RHOB|nr:3'-5' exonuclease [Aquimixticola soesokkakensis]SLN19522.1 DNA polymerase III PolC-type [Aquimixticola soesokkakensis]
MAIERLTRSLTARLGLRARVFCFFALLAGTVVALIGLGMWLGLNKTAQTGRPQDGFLLAGIIAAFGALAMITWIWLLFDEHLAKPIQRLAGSLLVRARSDQARDIDPDSARYLGSLAPAARAVTRHLADSRHALTQTLAAETTQLIAEKDRLAALTGDLPVGIILASGTHRLAFYNGAAAQALETGAMTGLGHSLFDFIRPAPVRAAYARLCTAPPDADDPVLALTLATVNGKALIGARLRLLQRPSTETPEPPYILTLDDITGRLTQTAAREALIFETLDTLRPAVASLRTVIAARETDPTLAQNPYLTRALLDDMARVTQAVASLDARAQEMQSDWWPMDTLDAQGLTQAVEAHLAQADLAIATDTLDNLPLSVDPTALPVLIAHLARAIAGPHQGRALSLLVSQDGDTGGAMIALGWTGEPLPVDRLHKWLDEPLETGLPDLTGRRILDLHGTDCWPEFGRLGRAVLKLPLRPARRTDAIPERRLVAYDFDLLWQHPTADLAARPLSHLSCVVFDTETTGLSVEEDEIVQIAALRVVNGRIIAAEQLERLVNPERDIPARASAIHGITQAMVADQPTIGPVARQFHSFARDAVLVAHNAPFDLGFLARHSAQIKRSFDHPVLDTVLLSAVLFGQEADHSLDAICARLGIDVAPQLRHTAMGDTQLTAQAFVQMIAMLHERGIETFGQAIAASRQHGRLLKDLNAAPAKTAEQA